MKCLLKYTMSTQFTLTNINILLAEDDVPIAKIYAKFLSKKGANIFLARDGIQTLEILSKRDIDILLMDLGMPGMDGYDTLQHVRKNQHTTSLPVIILSNTTMDERYDWYAKILKIGVSGIYKKYETSLKELPSLIEKALHVEST